MSCSIVLECVPCSLLMLVNFLVRFLPTYYYIKLASSYVRLLMTTPSPQLSSMLLPIMVNRLLTGSLGKLPGEVTLINANKEHINACCCCSSFFFCFVSYCFLFLWKSDQCKCFFTIATWILNSCQDEYSLHPKRFYYDFCCSLLDWCLQAYLALYS